MKSTMHFSPNEIDPWAFLIDFLQNLLDDGVKCRSSIICRKSSIPFGCKAKKSNLY